MDNYGGGGFTVSLVFVCLLSPSQLTLTFVKIVKKLMFHGHGTGPIQPPNKYQLELAKVGLMI